MSHFEKSSILICNFNILDFIQDEEDLHEITSALRGGLRSWLSFGTTMTSNKQKERLQSSDDEDNYGPRSVGRPQSKFR